MGGFSSQTMPRKQSTIAGEVPELPCPYRIFLFKWRLLEFPSCLQDGGGDPVQGWSGVGAFITNLCLAVHADCRET